MRLLQMRYAAYLILFLSASTACGSQTKVTASSKNLRESSFYGPQFRTTLKTGNKRTLTSVDGIIPAWSERHKKLLFLDIRGVRDQRSDREGNIGLGYRHRISSLFLGGYTFLDLRRSKEGFSFKQGTFGAEILHPWAEARLNVYRPQKKEFVVEKGGGVGSTEIRPQGHFFYYKSLQGVNTYQGALPGYDTEIGFRLPLTSLKSDYDTRLFAGYYRFARSGYDTVKGHRFRGEFIINDVLEKIGFKNSQLKIGAEVSHDRIRGQNNFIEIGLRIPFGKRSTSPKFDPYDRLLTTPIVRDVDIITSKESQTRIQNRLNEQKAVTQESLVLDAQGNPFDVYYVDNTVTGPGSGTYEDPFDLVQSAIDAVGDGDVIYIRNTGTPYTETIDTRTTFPNGFTHILQGGGAPLTNLGLTLIPASSATEFQTPAGGSTILHGQGIFQSHNLVLKGFNFTLSSGAASQALLTNGFVQSHSMTIDSCEFSGPNDGVSDTAGLRKGGLFDTFLTQPLNISNTIFTGLNIGIFMSNTNANSSCNLLGNTVFSNNTLDIWLSRIGANPIPAFTFTRTNSDSVNILRFDQDSPIPASSFTPELQGHPNATLGAAQSFTTSW